MNDANTELKIINGYFPELIEIKGSEFYFKNKTISVNVLHRSYIGYLEPGDSVKLRGKYLTLMLYLENEPYGELELDFDFELDQETCVMLFNLGIRIIYWQDGIMQVYDTQGINRRFVIENIIEND